MEVQTYGIAGLSPLLISRHIGDERGYFAEIFRADLFARHIGDYRCVQDNGSHSVKAGSMSRPTKSMALWAIKACSKKPLPTTTLAPFRYAFGDGRLAVIG